jgi:hypothetical protein
MFNHILLLRSQTRHLQTATWWLYGTLSAVSHFFTAPACSGVYAAVHDQILVLEWRILWLCTVTSSLNMRHSNLNMALFVFRRQKSKQWREKMHVVWKQWLIRPISLPLPSYMLGSHFLFLVSSSYFLPGYFSATLGCFFFKENLFSPFDIHKGSFVLICTAISLMKFTLSVLQKFGPCLDILTSGIPQVLPTFIVIVSE